MCLWAQYTSSLPVYLLAACDMNTGLGWAEMMECASKIQLLVCWSACQSDASLCLILKKVSVCIKNKTEFFLTNEGIQASVAFSAQYLWVPLFRM